VVLVDVHVKEDVSENIKDRCSEKLKLILVVGFVSLNVLIVVADIVLASKRCAVLPSSGPLLQVSK
jgi:hypothetical protein